MNCWTMEDERLIPARMLNEWTYCERLGVLEWVHGEFDDSADTVEGTWQHRRVDRPGRALPAAPEVGEPQEEAFRTRSVWLSSEAEGLTAKIDVVEVSGGEVVPVDTKKGWPAPCPEGVWEPERVQLCAQGLVLRASGYACDHGFIWFVGARRRVRVEFDAALVARTRELVAAFREAAARGVLPAPLEDSPKCPRCSLVAICLPDETRLLAEAAQARGAVVAEGGALRQLLAPRTDRWPLYVTEQGARVGVSKGELVVKIDDKEAVRARLGEVEGIGVFGNVQVSSQAISAALREGVTIDWFSYGGWHVGTARGHWHKNVVLRQAQYEVAADAERSLAVARELVRGKIRNQRTLLRRNAGLDRGEAGMRELARLAEAALVARDAGELLGFEGSAARLYFQRFGGMLRGPLAEAYGWEGRNRRPPRDPVNALLSYAYSLLVRDTVAAVSAVGFDPYLGFFHRPRYGRPALALDLMEEVRPLIADSVVLGMVNNGEVTPGSFVVRADGCNLTTEGRRAFLRAYERRVDQVITHPLFGYQVTWRRMLEVQARLLGRHVMGEIGRYVPIETR